MPQAGQSVPVSYPAAELASDLNVVIVGWNNATSTISSVVDTAGNHYQVAGGDSARGTNLSQAIDYAPNVNAIGGEPGHGDVQPVGSVPGYPDPGVQRVGSDGAVRRGGVGRGSSTSANSGSVATTSPNELLVGGGRRPFPAPGSRRRSTSTSAGIRVRDGMTFTLADASVTQPTALGGNGERRRVRRDRRTSRWRYDTSATNAADPPTQLRRDRDHEHTTDSR